MKKKMKKKLTNKFHYIRTQTDFIKRNNTEIIWTKQCRTPCLEMQEEERGPDLQLYQASVSEGDTGSVWRLEGGWARGKENDQALVRWIGG